MPQSCGSEKVPLSILYDDGVEEDLPNIMEHRWRLVRFLPAHPPVSWEINVSLSHYHNACMEEVTIAEKSGKRKDVLVGTGDYNISAEDFASLREGKWLTDVVIDTFAKVLIRISVNPDDKRFLVISSQAIVCARSHNSRMRESLCKWISGLELHEVDMILWPIHDVKSSHWSLCVAFTDNREALLLDPFRPRNCRPARGNLADAILTGLSCLSDYYSKKYKDFRQWKMISPKKLAT